MLLGSANSCGSTAALSPQNRAYSAIVSASPVAEDGCGMDVAVGSGMEVEAGGIVGVGVGSGMGVEVGGGAGVGAGVEVGAAVGSGMEVEVGATVALGAGVGGRVELESPPQDSSARVNRTRGISSRTSSGGCRSVMTFPI